jgi:hypothetical protein
MIRDMYDMTAIGRIDSVAKLRTTAWPAWATAAGNSGATSNVHLIVPLDEAKTADHTALPH